MSIYTILDCAHSGVSTFMIPVFISLNFPKEVFVILNKSVVITRVFDIINHYRLELPSRSSNWRSRKALNNFNLTPYLLLFFLLFYFLNLVIIELQVSFSDWTFFKLRSWAAAYTVNGYILNITLVSFQYYWKTGALFSLELKRTDLLKKPPVLSPPWVFGCLGDLTSLVTPPINWDLNMKIS